MKSSKYQALQVDDNGYVDYGKEAATTWATLMQRQEPMALQYACSSYVHGLATLNAPSDQPAQIPDVNKILLESTGWSLEPVPALINFKRFFGLLAQRKFPAATFMRTPEEIDYLEEPDLFHEVIGHCPMLTNSAFAEFSQWVGTVGSGASPAQQTALARLYWFTVEFGLIKEGSETKIFGGGILSSPLEILHSQDLSKVEHRPFDIKDILRTTYKINEPQPTYFVLESLDQLLELRKIDIFAEIDAAIHDLEEAKAL